MSLSYDIQMIFGEYRTTPMLRWKFITRIYCFLMLSTLEFDFKREYELVLTYNVTIILLIINLMIVQLVQIYIYKYIEILSTNKSRFYFIKMSFFLKLIST